MSFQKKPVEALPRLTRATARLSDEELQRAWERACRGEAETVRAELIGSVSEYFDTSVPGWDVTNTLVTKSRKR